VLFLGPYEYLNLIYEAAQGGLLCFGAQCKFVRLNMVVKLDGKLLFLRWYNIVQKTEKTPKFSFLFVTRAASPTNHSRD
jgi:hypothetical protein